MGYKILDLKLGEYFIRYDIFDAEVSAIYCSRSHAEKTIDYVCMCSKSLTWPGRNTTKRYKEQFEIMETLEPINTREEDSPFFKEIT
jgi:hypothetical protein